MLPPSTATRVRLQRRPDFGSPVMYQTWRDLLFLHWSIPPQIIQETLPEGLFADTYRGDAYISVVSFKMCHAHPRGLPPVPKLSDSLELNLRTYVYNEAGIPGVWFYSLDADNRILVYLANWLWGLPYFKASIRYVRQDETRFIFLSQRKGYPEASSTRLAFSVGTPRPPCKVDSLEFFLLERYMFFGYIERTLKFTQGRIHHKPYPFHGVSIGKCELGLLTENDFSLDRPPEAAQFSPGVDVEVFGRIREGVKKTLETRSFRLRSDPESALIGERSH